jgi:hypothetical protein
LPKPAHACHLRGLDNEVGIKNKEGNDEQSDEANDQA